MVLAILGLLPAIPHIVLGVEHLFGHGGGTVKKQAAMSSVADMINLISQLPNQTGTGTGKGADSSMMKFLDSLIESTVTYLNESGTMTHQTASK